MRRRPPSKSSASGTTCATLAASTPGTARDARSEVVVELRPALGRVVQHRRIDGGDEDAVDRRSRRRAAPRPAGCGRTGRRGRAAPPTAPPGRRPAPRGAATRRARSGSGRRAGWRPVEAARGLQRRRQAERDRGERRRARGRPPARCRRSRSRAAPAAGAAAAAARARRASTARARARRRGEGGEQQRFDEQLAHEPPAARAERQADGDFGAPIGRAGDEQAGDVGAGDEQHQAHRQREHEQEAGHRPDGVGREAQRLLAGDGDAARPVTDVGPLLRVRLVEAPPRPRVSCACAWAIVASGPQPADDGAAAIAASAGARRPSPARRRRDRDRGRGSSPA